MIRIFRWPLKAGKPRPQRRRDTKSVFNDMLQSSAVTLCKEDSLLNTRTRRLWLMSIATIGALVIGVCTTQAQTAEPGFQSIFDGKTLVGWHGSAKTGHSKTSGNKSGGRWVVENGAIVGSQDIPGNGGIVITNKAFGNFEVVLEMNNDFGPDSGLFMRSTEEGAAYQAMIDYHSKGNLMGVYGERMQGKPTA